MRSSSTDGRGFWPHNAGAWARLALVAVLGAGALVAPAVGVGKTGAIYTDSETAGFDVMTSLPPTATAVPTADPTAAPTDPATTAPTDPATTAPLAAMTAVGLFQAAAPVPVTTPAAGPTASPTPSPVPTTQPTGRGRSHAPGPVGPPPPH